MRVEQLMSRGTVTCRPQDDLAAVVDKMVARDCGVIPVVDDDGRVVGIVTDRDALLALHRERCLLGRLQVADAMTPDAHCCAMDEPIERAEEIMRERRIRRLPVVDGAGRLAGMLTLADMARSGLRDEQVAALMAALARSPQEDEGVQVSA